MNTDTAITMLLAMGVAAVVSFLATPMVKNLAYKVGAIDVPKDNRRMHKVPIPRLGGLAIFLAFLLSVLVFAKIDRQMQGILLGATMIVVLGVMDDIMALNALPKLIVQILAAGIAVYHGCVIQFVSNPNVFSSMTYLNLGWWSYPITIIWIVAITNAVNLIDGLDGLAVGVSAISTASITVIALMVAETNVAVVLAALFGACLGFIPYNMNPAKIFMGDTGATFLGYILATLSVTGLFKMYAIISFAVPFLILGVPIFDICFAFLRRIAKGQNPMKADRGHVHHRLIDMGFSQKQAVAISYMLAAILGLAAVLLTSSGELKALILIGTIFVVGAIGMRVIFGTRPEAIKMAPLVKELERREEIESYVCLTGQHREMLDSVMEIFDLKADFDLNIMEKRQTLSTITTKTLLGMEKVFEENKPDLILVHGDTSTTFAGALAAFYHQVKVGHVEAGLRTWDKYSPFPEEMNRTLVGDIADLHFSPTKANAENLRRESVMGDVFITGNTAIDAMRYTVSENFRFGIAELDSLDFANRRVIVVTCHRRENYGKPMQDIMHAILEVVNSHPDVEVVYPVHLSPVVRECAFPILGGHERIHLIDPVNVEQMHNLMSRCYMVMTDSGGLQEEAPALGKPVLVMRRETERPEAVAAGTAKLAGVEKDVIVSMASELLENPEAYARMAKAVNPYGDGHASARIADAILWHFGLREGKPADFCAE